MKVPQEDITTLFEGLGELSYYDYLGIEAYEDYVSVRDAFYARAQLYHPDRFVRADDEEVKERVYAVYKRMTEAYHVLMEPELRAAYDAGLADGQIRLPGVVRSRRLTAEERQISNHFARMYLRAAQAKLLRGDSLGAWIDTRLGLSLEDAPPLRQLFESLDRDVQVTEAQLQEDKS